MLSEESIRDRLQVELCDLPKSREEILSYEDFIFANMSLLKARMYAEVLEDQDAIKLITKLQQEVFSRPKRKR